MSRTSHSFAETGFGGSIPETDARHTRDGLAENGTGSPGATGGHVSTATPTKTPEGNAESAVNHSSEGDVQLWHPDEDGWD
jgi:hypothetical protein